jgi:glucose-1-phosphate thymidylyltransferase
LLGDGASWGVSITFLEQTAPNGIAEALIIGEEWLDGAPCALILGDNLFFGKGFTGALDAAMDQKVGALIFAYRVNNPGDYGVVGFETDGTAREIVEKSANPPSDFAVTGLYLYDHRASAFCRALTPSARGELEITDLNMAYLKDGSLAVERLDEATTWLDTGTHRSLLAAAQFVSVIEERQGIRIGCPEEAAFRRGWIDRAALIQLAEAQSKSGYGAYLLKVADSSKVPG